MSDRIKNIIKDAGLRATPIRLEVLDVITKEVHAVSQNDIEDSISSADRVTLYRTLKTFEQKGIIHKIKDTIGQEKYAVCETACDEHNHNHEHVHFTCNECHNTYCLDKVKIPSIDLPTGYSSIETNISITGTCIKCQ